MVKWGLAAVTGLVFFLIGRALPFTARAAGQESSSKAPSRHLASQVRPPVATTPREDPEEAPPKTMDEVACRIWHQDERLATTDEHLRVFFDAGQGPVPLRWEGEPVDALDFEDAMQDAIERCAAAQGLELQAVDCTEPPCMAVFWSERTDASLDSCSSVFSSRGGSSTIHRCADGFEGKLIVFADRGDNDALIASVQAPPETVSEAVTRQTYWRGLALRDDNRCPRTPQTRDIPP